MPDPADPLPDAHSTRVFDPSADDVATHVFDGNEVTHSAGTTGPVENPAARPDGVPGYAILRELGRGGMGVVYLARQIGLNREVALKMVLAGGHASVAERIRFMAEAEAVAAVQHPGIVQVFDFGTHAGQPFFALEYLPGGSLADELQTALPEPRDAAGLIAKLARAVQAAHEKGIIHRDIKPSNVLLTAEKTPKLTDFGLARKTDSGSGLTQTGAVLGTPSYMSPEQAMGQHDRTGSGTDVYALGAVLYECLTGRPPFRAATAVETVRQVIADEPVPPRRLVPKLPRDLETICLKCLQKDPAKRYLSAAALADDLDRYLAGDSIVARPVPVWEKGWRWAKRNPSYFVAAGIMAATVVASIVLLASKNASLTVERNAARTAQSEAELANAEADRQRLVAKASEAKAVAAQEETAQALRVAEVQRDTIQTQLEEAVAFFRTLGAAESKDPIVRRQAARAYFQSAGAYLALGDYAKVREMAQSAADVYGGLAADAPADPAPLRGKAEATALMGHGSAVSGAYQDAQIQYQTAAELADRAVRLDPANVDSQVVLAETISSLAMYYSISNPPRATEFNAKTLAIAEKLMAVPAPGFKPRLLLVSTLTNAAATDLNMNRHDAAQKKIDRARAEITVLEKMKPPTAQAAERFTVSKAALSVLHGNRLFRAGKEDDGLDAVRAGIQILGPLVTAQPKSFPNRYQLLQHQLTYAEMLTRAGKKAPAEDAFRRFDALRDAMTADNPALGWMKTVGVMQRSAFLVERARDGMAADVEAAFATLLKGLDDHVALIVRYNRACAFAQLAKSGPAADRSEYAGKAVAELDGLLDTVYFQIPASRNHLDDDADLDPLRDRDDFKRFLARAKAIRSPAPPSRESAPRREKLN
jgi:tetratricopeptide (TPR) repeat protein